MLVLQMGKVMLKAIKRCVYKGSLLVCSHMSTCKQMHALKILTRVPHAFSWLAPVVKIHTRVPTEGLG